MRVKPDHADHRFPGSSLVYRGDAVNPEPTAQFDGGDALRRQLGHNLKGCGVISRANRDQFHVRRLDDRPVLGRIGARRHE